MRYLELTARVAPGDAERTSDILREIVDGGAWTEAPFSQRDLESDADVDPHAHRLVHAYAGENPAAPDVPAQARAALARAGIAAEVTQRTVAEEDWAESWKEHFHVERFGEHLVVVPTWRSFAPQPDDVVIALDPGMAFGTGQHETTRMCLEALERTVRPGMAVLDVGCGSGILSIAAAKLGAREVLAVDVDPNCARITSENARLNGVESSVIARTGSTGGAWPFEQAATGRCGIVVANIIARIIGEIAADLAAALAPGGRLIASGIIGERETETGAALTAQGLRVECVRAMGDWRCIEAVRG
jgi:ribosomal protein L11 methyltransferase